MVEEKKEGLSFIIATRWASEALELCLKSIIEGSVLQNQIIVIADRPSWQTLRLLQEDFKMIHGRDYWIVDFGHLHRSWDFGVQFVKNDYLCITNDDVVFSKAWGKAVIEAFDGKKNRIVGTAYYVGNTKGNNYMDLGYPRLKYTKRPRDNGEGFDWEKFHSLVPAPSNYAPFCAAGFLMAMHKDIYKRVNGLTFFSQPGQGHELAMLERAGKLGFEQYITTNGVWFHFGAFSNSDMQQSNLRTSPGWFKCNVCGHLDESQGDIEYPHTEKNGKLKASRRGLIAYLTGLYLCERCKRDGWYIDQKEQKLVRRR